MTGKENYGPKQAQKQYTLTVTLRKILEKNTATKTLEQNLHTILIFDPIFLVTVEVLGDPCRR